MADPEPTPVVDPAALFLQAQATPQPRPPRSSAAKIGDYTVTGELGRGGQGTVLRARDPAGREVAIKLLHATDCPARLEREAQTTASLNHPNVVRVHAAGHHAGRLYLVSELIEGARSLDDVLDELQGQGAEARRKGLELILEAARALGYAHEQGVTHRDVKPDNLLVDAEGRLRVTDFGLALPLSEDTLTRTGGILGTPRYMPPEQFLGQRARQGPWSDVWSLGVILYRFLCGVFPFPDTTITGLLEQVTGDDPEPPRSYDATIPRAVERVVLRALERDPEERHPNATAFAMDLLAALEPPSSRRPHPAWVAAAAVGFLALAVGWVSWPSAPPPLPTVAGNEGARITPQPQPKPHAVDEPAHRWLDDEPPPVPPPGPPSDTPPVPLREFPAALPPGTWVELSPGEAPPGLPPESWVEVPPAGEPPGDWVEPPPGEQPPAPPPGEWGPLDEAEQWLDLQAPHMTQMLASMVLEQGPPKDRYRAQVLLGLALLDLERLDEAERVLTDATGESPVGLGNVALAEVLAWRGRPAEAKRQLELAIVFLDPAARVYACARVTYALGDAAAAYSMLDSALRSASAPIPLLLSTRARIARATGDFSSALRDYEQLEFVVPSPDAFLGHMEVLLALGQPRQAQELLAQLGEILPPDVHLRLSTEALRHLGRHDEARELAKRAIQEAPIPPMLLVHARLALSDGRFEVAEESARQATVDGDATAYAVHGEALERLGRDREAHMAYDRALRGRSAGNRRPTTLAALARRAQLRERLHDALGAREDAVRALTALGKADAEWAAELRACLERVEAR